MLTAIREIKINGKRIAETPAIIPSFSSKGFPEVDKIIETFSSLITDSALVSAYDISHKHITGAPSYPDYLILDSGGYECSKDVELSDIRSNNYVETEWSTDQLKEVLDTWAARQPTIAVSYDHPKHRFPLKTQIDRAKELFGDRKMGRELLIKPESTTAERVNIDAVRENIYELRNFDVIGFTEKELGYSIFDRMVQIKKVRIALTNAGLSTPIHIFGSLDTISTPLYFFAGADIFDGLTWLRYSYSYGHAVYQKNAAALKHGIRINDKDIDPLIWFENYQEMMNLEYAMRRHIKEKSFASFKTHAGFFEQAFNELQAAKG